MMLMAGVEAGNVATAILALFALATATIVLGWGYFRRYRVSRPPIGVMTLGDVLVLIVGIILIPYLYLALPGWLVGAILALGTFGILQLLLEPVLPGRWLSWVVAGGLVGADVLLAARAGTRSLSYLAVNDLVLILAVAGVTNLWVQSGFTARDLAVLAAVLTLYDLIATTLLPLTNELIGRLVGLPFTPLLTWPTGDDGWLGLGLGDLLLATVGPLVFRKAFGKPAGIVALVIALATIAAVMILPLTGWLQETFPVMVVLGPLLVAQYGYWIRRQGTERTTAAYLVAEPGPAQCVSAARPAPVSGG
jgi:hypothetical protein